MLKNKHKGQTKECQLQTINKFKPILMQKEAFLLIRKDTIAFACHLFYIDRIVYF